MDDESKTKVVVYICDVHAEDATVKTAKAAYLGKQKKIEDVLAQARALGLNIQGATQQGGLLVSQVQPKQIPNQSPKLAPVVEAVVDDPDMIPTEMIDRKGGMQSVGGTTNFGQIASHVSHDFDSFNDKLPEDARRGKAKMTVVEGREGQPLSIPEKRVDGTGTTRIKVTKIENDTRLQSRFKKMANDTISNDRVPNFARAGYQNTQSDCPICRGKCVIIQQGKEVSCPKCNGAGVISVY